MNVLKRFLRSHSVYVLVLLLSLIAVTFFVLGQRIETGVEQKGTTTILINGVTIHVLEAKTPAEMSKGLGERDSLPSDQGMLFRFNPPQVASFWMKGMRFPLDFIWIRDNKVIDLTENVAAPPQTLAEDQLPQVNPKSEVDAVLEVNAGFVHNHHIAVGDEVQNI